MSVSEIQIFFHKKFSSRKKFFLTIERKKLEKSSDLNFDDHFKSRKKIPRTFRSKLITWHANWLEKVTSVVILCAGDYAVLSDPPF